MKVEVHDKQQRIPFDLERALKGDPIITRDGRKAKLVHIDPREDIAQPVCVAIISDHDDVDTFWFDKKGNYDTEPYMCQSDEDLFMDQKKVTVWFAIRWDARGGHAITGSYGSKESLEQALNAIGQREHYHILSVDIPYGD